MHFFVWVVMYALFYNRKIHVKHTCIHGTLTMHVMNDVLCPVLGIVWNYINCGKISRVTYWVLYLSYQHVYDMSSTKQ